MIAAVVSKQKKFSPKVVRVVYESNGRKVLYESGVDPKEGPCQKWLDYNHGVLRRKTVITNGKVRRIVFSTKFPGDVLYTQTIKTVPDGRQVTEEGWTGKHGYFSLKMPNGRKFAHFGQFVIDEWDNSVGRVREVRIDKDGASHMEKITVQKKGQAPEILDESRARKKARSSMRILANRPDLSAKEKWAKIREVITRYRQKVM